MGIATRQAHTLDTVASPVLQVNFLPATFSAQTISGYKLAYQSHQHLRALQDDNLGKCLFKRVGDEIFAVPLQADFSLDYEPQIFSSATNWGVFERLLEHGIRQLLKEKYPQANISQFGALWFRVEGERNDVVREALTQQPNALSKLGFIHIYRKYQIWPSHLSETITTTESEPAFGVVIDVSTRWQIGANIHELIAKGINVNGCVVVPLDSKAVAGIGHHSLGRIAEVKGNDVHLAEFRDRPVVDARHYTIAASLENVTRCATALLNKEAKAALTLIRSEVGKLMNADGQLKRIGLMAGILSQEPIMCATGLSARIDNTLLQTSPEVPVRTLQLAAPNYILNYARPPVQGSIASALSSQGPFDQDSFARTTPHILVVTPKRYQGRVEQFLRIWKDGRLSSPYAKGFVSQYKLRGCDFHIVEVQEASRSLADSYEEACLRALEESRQMVRRYDLAFVVTSEKHRLLGLADPYLTAKATLMNDGIPVQAVEIETIDLPPANQRFILNNLALACYAKLGGTPWVLASPKGQGISHELIIGMGSATLSDTNFGNKERYVGIVSLFNYDGVYLLSHVTNEAAYEEYAQALYDSLLSSVERVSIQKGWQPGQRVRLIFHTFKPLKNFEIDTIKRLVTENLTQYTVEFAFLVLGDEHPWTVYDPNAAGRSSNQGEIIGKFAPARGITVVLNTHKALLSVTGPAELKMWSQGCPSPLQVRLHGASTFTDLEYLTRQVFDFTYMSWKTYNLLPQPITIEYSEAIAKLLGRLRRIRNWNSNVFRTTQLGASLWFL
jgi:hypothetical protein